MKTLLIILAVFVSVNSFAQIQATTEDGRKVTLKSDGTWEYVTVEEVEASATGINDPCVCLYKLKINEADEFAGVIKKRIESVRIGTSDAQRKLNGYVSRDDELIVVGLTYYGDLGCMSSSGSYAIFKFEDGTTVRIEHIGDVDCGDIMFFMGDITSYLDEFRTKKIKKIRLGGTELYDDATLDKPTFFSEAINCCLF